MTCRSTDFKKFQKRIRRTLNYGGTRRTIMSVQISRMLAAFLNTEDFEMAENLGGQGYVSPYNMITAMIYMARLKRTKEQEFNRFNTSELYLSSLMIATKFLNDGNLDEFVWNDEWASASGLALPDLNQLELKTLQALDWDIFVSEGNFDEALLSVENWIARDLYAQNGQMTYSDLFILSRSLGMESIKAGIQMMAKLLLELVVAYLAIFAILAATTATLPTFYQKPQMQLDLDLLCLLPIQYDDAEETTSFIPFPSSPPAALSSIGNGSECLFAGNWSSSSIPAFPSWIGAVELEQLQNFSIY